MARFRLLALDVDGTLVNSNHEVTPTTRAAILRAKEAGLHIALATGRRYSRTLPLVHPLGIDAPLVTASGALIKRPSDHHTLFRAAFDEQALAQTLQTVSEFGLAPILYADTFGEGFDYYCHTTSVACPLLSEFFALNPDCHRLAPDLIEAPPSGVFAGFAMGSLETMLTLEAALNDRLGEQLYVHVLRSPRYAGYMCEIAPAGVSKWSGVQYLAAELGIPAAEICTVGDDVNDIPMIQGAGLGIAMSNALPAVKEAADRVAPSNDEDGVVEIVRWILDAT